MSLLSRSTILETKDLNSEDVPVPEWGGTVRVRALTGEERDAFEIQLAGDGDKKKRDLNNLRAKLVARSVVDEAGARIFTDDDVHKLGLKSAAALDTVFTVAQRLSGLRKEDVEELAGNSDAATSGASTSD